MTYKEIVYACMDLLKLSSDDSYYTENHIIFIASKMINMILKQRYSDIKKQIPESNYQTICVDLQITDAIEGVPCSGQYLKSVQEVPVSMKIGNQKVYPTDYFQGEITLVSRERLRYVGHNKWLKNIIYCALAPDNHLYFKSSNPLHLNLKKVRMTGIFDDIQKASEMSCDSTDNCDIMDMEFPLEAALVPQVIELTVKEFDKSQLIKEDEQNDAKDGQPEENRTR